METSLILAALAVLTISGILVAVMIARSRRPELRMSREEDLDLEVADDEALMRSLEPPRISPIDRSAPILEIEPVTERETRRLPPGDEGR